MSLLLCLTGGAAWAQYMPPKFVPPSWRGQVDTNGLSSEKIVPALTIDAQFRPSLIDNPPRFKGGETALKRFLQKNLRFPPLLLRSNVEGWTRIQFIVDVNGCICNPVVHKSLYWAWDDEVLRVAKLLDYRFEPATYNGELVASSYVLSVPFSIK
ncbi:energy transducer TonB [Hymenobacter norwichensis]|nr:energy transducer TonB [Hymenobacter norwichensis]